MKWGLFLVLSLLPTKAICADDGEKKDDKKSFDVNEFMKNFKVDKDAFQGIQDRVKKELQDGGSLVPVKTFFESGMPGQVMEQ